MFHKITIATMMFSALLVLTPSLGAATRVIVQPFFGYGYYGPAYHSWYGHPVRVYVPTPLTGELKLDTRARNAMVYVDGGYLGVARDLKRFDLRSGAHEIALRDAHGNVLFHEKVAITPGRTTEIDAMGIAG